MSRYRSLVLVCLIGACDAQGAGDPKPESAAAQPVAPVTPAIVDAVAVTPAPTPAPVKPAEGKIGVAACDEYLDLYRGCIPSLQEQDRPHHDEVVEQLAVAWAQARGDTKVADTLADTCTSARAASKVSLPDCKGW